MDACLSDNAVAALVSGRLAGGALEDAEHHLDGCAACRELVGQALQAASSTGSGAAAARSGASAASSGARAAVGPPPVGPVAAGASDGAGAGASGARIGRYRVIREVGSGSMGTVYAAEDPDLGRDIALKVLRPAGRDDADSRARLAREARAMARLAHPNVITVHEVGAAGDQLFIAMELVRGATLRRWLAAAQRDWRAIADVLCAAGRGLAAAHAAGIVHRDFKPDNVLVGDDGRVRVTDFGLAQLAALDPTLPLAGASAAPSASEAAESAGGAGARSLSSAPGGQSTQPTGAGAATPAGAGRSSGAAGEPSASAASSLTASGALLGTPAYMAPEQLRGGSADERSDLFAFCVAFWEALHGERPFAARTIDELRGRVVAGEVRPPPADRAVPGGLRAAIRRGLATAPGERPASMAALLSTIEAAIAAAIEAAPAAPGLPRMFGRATELARAEDAVRRARSGSGALVLVTGEAGIGKSRLAREVAARAAAAGMRVLWGRAWEAGGAMPYWPWVQVFRALGGDPFAALAAAPGETAREARFRLFDAAARAIDLAAAREPLAILLEDLHAADLGSLLLLVFVARQIAAAPVLVLATAREIEARAAPEVGDTLALAARDAESISLARLGRDDVAAWLADRAASASPDEIYRVTEGNPLFVEEVLRAGGGRPLAMSDGIRVALDAHLARLAPDARGVLELAAVTGRQFGSRELAALAGMPHAAVVAALGPACELGVVEPIESEQLQFTHVLLRERLHQALPVARRAEAHWRAGLQLEAAGADPAVSAAHLLAGADAGDAEHAARAAERAAQRAIAGFAYEEAISLGERGLAVLGAARSALASALEAAVGEGLLRSSQPDAGRARCLRAAEIARDIAAPEALARAALAYACEQTTASVDPVMVRLLEEALAAISAGDHSLGAAGASSTAVGAARTASDRALTAISAGDRGNAGARSGDRALAAAGAAARALAARVAARLSAALVPPRSEADFAPIARHARDALAVARQLGDADTLVYVLHYVRAGASYLMTADERFELSRELVALARDQQPQLAMRSGPDLATRLLERGQRSEADACLADLARLYAAHGPAAPHWRLAMVRAAFALFDGDLDGSDRLLDEGVALAAAAGVSGGAGGAPPLWAQHRVSVAIAAGDPARLAPHAERVLAALGSNVWFEPFRAWTLAAIGRRGEAGELVAKFPARPYLIQGLLIAAEACLLVEDRAAAAVLYRNIAARCPDARFFWGGIGTGFAVGPVPRLLGELALLAGDLPAARRHFEHAVAMCRDIGTPPFLARSLDGLARCTAAASGDHEARHG